MPVMPMPKVANGKIADPLGKSVNEANPAAEESPFSWNSVSDFSDNIRSVRMLYTGDNFETRGAGLQNLLEIRNPALSREVLAKIDAAIAKIQGIPGAENVPFRKAISDRVARARVEAAQKEVGELFATLQQKVLPYFK
jgi:putative iron-regulated protein